MTTLTPDLWGDGIAVKVRSPLVILRQQANLLEQKTGGILRAEVQSVHSEERVKHGLVVMALALRYSISIVEVEHGLDMPYPASLTSINDKSASFLFGASVGFPKIMNLLEKSDSLVGKITSEPEFIEELGKALKSARVSAVISSLIARSNEIAESPSNGATNG